MVYTKQEKRQQARDFRPILSLFLSPPHFNSTHIHIKPFHVPILSSFHPYPPLTYLSIYLSIYLFTSLHSQNLQLVRKSNTNPIGLTPTPLQIIHLRLGIIRQYRILHPQFRL